MVKLNELRARPKYVEDAGYTGMAPESDRLLAATQINALIDGLRDKVQGNPSKQFVLGEFSRTMSTFPGFDTEDREHFLGYLQEIMTILGIESSDGLLNGWMYGPILGPLADRQREREKYAKKTQNGE